MQRRAATLLTSILLLVGLLCAGALIPVPYAELSPGPTVNTLGDHNGEPVLSIADEKTYETSGHLNMTTVRVTGVNYRMNLVEAVGDWLLGKGAVVPYETLYPERKSADEVEQQNAEEFSRSQESAKVAALTALGYDIPSRTVVGAVIEDSPAEGLLNPGDVIVAVDGSEITEPGQVAEAVTEHEAGDDVVFTVVPDEADDGEEQAEEITVTTEAAPEDSRAIVGIQAALSHELPFDIDIELADVGGPSAGLMFALGLIDKLTPDDLTGGVFVAGTGTIGFDGTVGPIGGVSMKTIAAREVGAEYFLTPEANCTTAAANVPDGLTLIRVGTMGDALEALELIRDGAPEALERCTED